jgi:starch synthase (maltosyl-transferring)
MAQIAAEQSVELDEQGKMKPAEGRKRVVIEEIKPQVDCGRYPARRFVGDDAIVSAAIFADGHDHVAARLLYRHGDEADWRAVAMTALPNDLWTASIPLDRLGMWNFKIEAWIDHFDTWCADLKKRLAAQPDPEDDDPAVRDLPAQNIPLALQSGARLLDEAASRAKGADARQLAAIAGSLRLLAEKDIRSTTIR